jgi:hypothetical protein
VAETVKTSVFIAKAPTSLVDFLFLIGQSPKEALVTGNKTLGWSRMASELLYGDKIVYYLSRLHSVTERLYTFEIGLLREATLD